MLWNLHILEKPCHSCDIPAYAGKESGGMQPD